VVFAGLGAAVIVCFMWFDFPGILKAESVS